jgi:hypothetical protein
VVATIIIKELCRKYTIGCEILETSGLLYVKRWSNIRYIERDRESSTKNPAINVAHVGAVYCAINGRRSPRLTLMLMNRNSSNRYAFTMFQHHLSTVAKQNKIDCKPGIKLKCPYDKRPRDRPAFQIHTSRLLSEMNQKLSSSEPVKLTLINNPCNK